MVEDRVTYRSTFMTQLLPNPSKHVVGIVVLGQVKVSDCQVAITVGLAGHPDQLLLRCDCCV